MKKSQWKIDRIWMVLAGLAGILLITFVACWIKGDNQRLAIPILLYKLIGLGSSVFLVLGELGHKIFDRVCLKGDSLDCHAVMKSPAAKIFGLIPMADLGVLYFSGGIIHIGLSIMNPGFFNPIYLLALFNLLTLPYTIFSVTYQAFRVKKWCPLCLIVQLAFWLEFLQFYPFLSAGFPRFRPDDFLLFFWSFGLPTLLWLLFRPILQKSIQFDNQK